MTSIAELIKAKQAAGEAFVSFEFFPPRTDEGVANLVPRMGRYQAQGQCVCVCVCVWECV
jgi:methylenetetrahydrofolate reductase (NADPH)